MAATSSQQSQRTALVAYGSETGNAQDVAEEVGRLLERLRFDTRVAEMDSLTLSHLVRYQVVCFVISTTGQGELPLNAQRFWKLLRSKRLQGSSLRSLNFTSFGLGDSSYPKFNWAHHMLSKRVLQLGAQRIHDRGEGDEQHPEGIDGAFISWSLSLRQHLLDLYPLDKGVEPISEDVLLTPKWTIDFVDTTTPSPGPEARSEVNGHTQLIRPDLPPFDLLPIADGLRTTVAENIRLTPENHWQDVRHLALDFLEPLSYGPGDVITIYPKNFPEDVSQFISLMGWESVADKPVHFISSTPTSEPPPISHSLPFPKLTIRTLLTHHLDIMSIPRRSFFALIAHFTTDQFHKDRLLEFTNPEFIDEYFDYTTRPRRSILEVLQEFETVKIPWQWLASAIPVIKGRQFSIASGGHLKQGPDGHTRMELLVAIVKYRTVIKRIRQGVCTRYITTLAPGQELCVTFRKGSIANSEAEFERPVVMIGPGTGVAPMRSLVYERLALAKKRHLNDPESYSSCMADDMLFFGCRNEQSDYFYREEWNGLNQETGLKVYPAFSRDQKRKVYVQDLLRQHSAEVYKSVHELRGFIYVCGSSGKMPQAVREALIEVFQKEGSLERSHAEAYLVGLEKEGRYKQETW